MGKACFNAQFHKNKKVLNFYLVKWLRDRTRTERNRALKYIFLNFYRHHYLLMAKS